MLKFWFSPYGRAARADYWFWLIVPFVALVSLALLIGPLILGHAAASVILLGTFALFFVSHMVVAIKRLHDQGISGWFCMALVLPFAAVGAGLAEPDLVDFDALHRASGGLRLVLLGVFSVIFAPFAYVLGTIWFFIGKDGLNRYGKDPLLR